MFKNYTNLTEPYAKTKPSYETKKKNKNYNQSDSLVLQSYYYVHFRTNNLGKGMNTLILPAMGYIVPLLFF